MDVHVARVPAGARVRRARVEARRAVGVLRVRWVRAELDLDAPGDLAERVPVLGSRHVGDAELDGPAARADRAGHEAPRRAPGHVAVRVSQVLRLGREALRGDLGVGVARAAPAAELARSPGPATLLRGPQPKVQRRAVLAGQVGRVGPAILHPDRGGAPGHVERDHHVGAAQVLAERSLDHLRGVNRVAAAAVRAERQAHRGGRRRGNRGERRNGDGGGEEVAQATHGARV